MDESMIKNSGNMIAQTIDYKNVQEQSVPKIIF